MQDTQNDCKLSIESERGKGNGQRELGQIDQNLHTVMSRASKSQAWSSTSFEKSSLSKPKPRPFQNSKKSRASLTSLI